MNKKIEYIKFVLPILIIFFWFIFTYTGKVPETSLPKAGTSNVVLYGVSVLSVVAIVLYRKITK